MHEDIKKLLDHSVEYASELLLETGDCYPFGAYLDTIGNVHPLEMEIDAKNVPQIGKVIEALTKYCSEEMAEKRMHGYCLSYEVKIQLSENTATDAICFEIMHQSETSVPKYYLPFTSKRLTKKDKEAAGNDPCAEEKTAESTGPQAELGELFAVK
jgi:hypothetical protein